jgi:hypothetical protein
MSFLPARLLQDQSCQGFEEPDVSRCAILALTANVRQRLVDQIRYPVKRAPIIFPGCGRKVGAGDHAGCSKEHVLRALAGTRSESALNEV